MSVYIYKASFVTFGGLGHNHENRGIKGLSNLINYCKFKFNYVAKKKSNVPCSTVGARSVLKHTSHSHFAYTIHNFDC